MEVIDGAANLSPKNEDENDVLDNIGQNGHNRRLACQCSLYGDVPSSRCNTTAMTQPIRHKRSYLGPHPLLVSCQQALSAL
ncbi:MAG: hypothetical protein LPH21_12995, partial [Shewanella sp.]|nr:hypothetical protein [Shewanella sp.]